jgi:PAS domain S-box-containing protein
MTPDKTAEELAAEIRSLQGRLWEAEETLRAIREGEVDALVINERRGERVYTLKGADRAFRLMIEEMQQGTVSLTADGRILYGNAGFSQIVKLPLDRAIHRPLQQFVAPEHHASLETFLRRGWMDGRSQGEVVLLAADGTRIPVSLAFNTLSLDDGVSTLQAVVTDLSEQKRIEELIISEDLARAANIAKDQFLATLSHELRTPLTPVMAVVSNLERDPRLPAEFQESITMVRRNVELEARLIDDLLDLTRISRGKLELERHTTDLREVILHAVQTCCAQETATGRLHIVEELKAADHCVWGDAPRLSQVFWNLLTNAVKFTPDGGTVSIRSWTEPVSDQTASDETAPDRPDTLVVQVSDTGIGIPSEVLPQIFSAFDQGEQGTSKRFGGLGLGLTISRAIMERHGGSLTAASAGSGEGAVFTVRIPACGDVTASAEAGMPRPAAEDSGEPESALHILLVEDHADTAEAMSALLSALGHRVVVAESVAAALAAAQEAVGLDLVISDLGLPDGNGHDLMRQLAERHSLRGIALSGYGMEADVRKSYEAGFQKHLTKPIDMAALQSAIRQVARQ